MPACVHACLSAVAFMVAVPAWAGPEACPQEGAVYEQAGSSARLIFDPSVRADDGLYHRFEIVFVENDVRLQGVVLPAEGLPRPWGMVMHDCPEGDVTGEEIAACMVWEGVIYSIDDAGGVTYLQGAGVAASPAASILMPDFGNAVTLSSAWSETLVSTAPSDLFELEGCRS